MRGTLLLLAAGAHLLLATQAASVPSRGAKLQEELEVIRLAEALKMSMIWPAQYPAKRARREAEGEVHDAEEGDDDHEDPTSEQPPQSGLRRWVIKMRNFLFGRRDLEGSENGEEDGQPQEGRTWVESLAQWFAHGIRNVLQRMGGAEGPPGLQQDGESQNQDDDGDADHPQPSPFTSTTALQPEPQHHTRAPSSTSSSESPHTAAPSSTSSSESPHTAAPSSTSSSESPQTAAPPSTTELPPLEPSRDGPVPQSPSDSPSTSTSGTIFDDETLAIQAAKSGRSGKLPAEETNELK